MAGRREGDTGEGLEAEGTAGRAGGGAVASVKMEAGAGRVPTGRAAAGAGIMSGVETPAGGKAPGKVRGAQPGGGRARSEQTGINNMLARTQGPEERKRLHAELIIENWVWWHSSVL